MEVAFLSLLFAQATPTHKPWMSVMSMSQLVLLVGAIGCLAILMIFTRKRLRSSVSKTAIQTAREQNRQRLAQLGPARDTIRDMEAVMFELEELSRQIHGRISTQFTKLETVIHDADERIDKLSRLSRELRGQSTVDVVVGDTAETAEPKLMADKSTPQPISRHTEVYKLADSGLTSMQIAKQVNKPTGEIELILSLRKTKAQVGL